MEENLKSYSHLPHLASLPHDRRTTDPNKLAERYNECENRIQETNKEIFYWERMSELAKKDQDRTNKEIDSIEYRLLWANNMQGTLDNILTDQKDRYNKEIGSHLHGLDEMDAYFDHGNTEGYNFYLDSRITEDDASTIKTILQNGKQYGYLTQDQVDTLKDFADNLEETADSLDINEIASENGFYYSIGEEDYDFEGVIPENAEGIEDWCIDMKSWSGDLKTFADNYNLNNDQNPAKAIVEQLWEVPQSTVDGWKEDSKQLKQQANEYEKQAQEYDKKAAEPKKLKEDYIKEEQRTHGRYAMRSTKYTKKKE